MYIPQFQKSQEFHKFWGPNLRWKTLRFLTSLCFYQRYRCELSKTSILCQKVNILTYFFNLVCWSNWGFSPRKAPQKAQTVWKVHLFKSIDFAVKVNYIDKTECGGQMKSLSTDNAHFGHHGILLNRSCSPCCLGRYEQMSWTLLKITLRGCFFGTLSHKVRFMNSHMPFVTFKW